MNLTDFRLSDFSKHPHLLLFGNPVSHSLSPMMHNTAADYYGMDIRYHTVALESGEFGMLASHFNSDFFRGANITIPYKLMIKDYVDRLDASAKAVDAVNTVVKRGGSLLGYNTDSYGFGVPLAEYREELEGGRAIVFGTGGATRAIIRALRSFGMYDIVLVSRDPASKAGLQRNTEARLESYESWSAFAEEAVLIVNATPLGMEPDMSSSPVRDEEQELLSGKICYDIVYKPLETHFLELANEAGARTIPGLEMLIHQGSKSFELWTGEGFPVEKIRTKLHSAIEDGI